MRHATAVGQRVEIEWGRHARLHGTVTAVEGQGATARVTVALDRGQGTATVPRPWTQRLDLEAAR